MDHRYIRINTKKGTKKYINFPFPSVILFFLILHRYINISWIVKIILKISWSMYIYLELINQNKIRVLNFVRTSENSFVFYIRFKASLKNLQNRHILIFSRPSFCFSFLFFLFFFLLIILGCVHSARLYITDYPFAVRKKHSLKKLLPCNTSPNVSVQL